MKLLDLCCGAGGAGEGYRLAGFEVTGVDNMPQPRYKPGQFILADAIEYLANHWHEYDVIHASPPCQRYSRTGRIRNNKDSYPDTISTFREALISTGKVYVIENVPGAPLLNYISLCGTMFGLQVIRHRWFESNKKLISPKHVPHKGVVTFPKGYDWSAFDIGSTHISVAGKAFKASDARIAMKIDWMTRPELAQAIPPAYTEYIGRQLCIGGKE